MGAFFIFSEEEKVNSLSRHPGLRTALPRLGRVTPLYRTMSSPSENLQQVQAQVDEAAKDRTIKPRLVAVSKMKPPEMIKECYDIGHRHFGENYVDQLIDKAPQLPDDIKWHFIGAIQSNKVKQIVSVPNVFMVETIDREKIANSFQKALEKEEDRDPLRVLVQVNPAHEDTKSGITNKEDLLALVRHIKDNCSKLQFSGLMVIGRPGELGDLDQLVSYKEYLLEQIPDLADLNPFELSMGMSDDFPDAIARGSTNVRVGSTI